MRPEEAIKILLALQAGERNLSYEKIKQAIKLGTSALQTFLFARHGGSWDPRALLPGEAPYKSIYAPGCNPSLGGLSALKIE